MLNELLQAANAIPNLPGTLHKSLKTLPKKPGYRILLDANAEIVNVIPHENISDLRKWQPSGNGFSTPVFNVLPLFPIFDPALDKEAAKKADESAKKALKAACKADAATWSSYYSSIRARCAQATGSWIDNKTNKVDEKSRKSLADVPAQLQALLPEDDPNYAVLRALCERLQRLSPERFFPELARQLETQLAVAYDEKLFKLYCATSEAEAAKPYNLLLDLQDWDEIGEYPVTHKKTAILLNDLLARRTSQDPDAATTSTPDAYGRPAITADEKFADVIVHGLGKVILRAMSKDAPCQKRYGKVEAESFIVGKASRERAKSALEYLAQKERQGKTWQYRGGNFFLFYPETELPALAELEVADLCSLPDSEDDEFTEQAEAAANFEARTERIAAALDGLLHESETLVHLIVLRKPDGHRTKLVAHRTFTMQGFISAARHWVAGVKTCPPVAFSRWGKGGEQRLASPGLTAGRGLKYNITPVQPYPYQVTDWLNTFWVRGDENQGKFKTFSPEDVLTLLLATDGSERQMAQRALRHALAGWSGFLVAAGAREHASIILEAGDKRAAALAALPSILALLLYKSEPNLTREHIMASPAFLVGRLLALADNLHLQYCNGVRNGQKPAQLLGNALMATALETPEAALALYGQRILPYHAWARTCDANEKGPETLAKYFLGQLSEVCSELSLLNVPERATDADKAQLILGYLAKIPAKAELQQTQPQPVQEESL